MELYQKRDLGTMLSDSFKFIIKNFSHLLTNYIIFNGAFVIFNIVRTFYMDAGDQLGFFAILILIIGGIVALAFIPIYMILYQEHGGANFNYVDIFNAYKKNLGKILIYILVLILLAIPLLIVFYIILLILMITVVGVLLFPLVFAFFALLLVFPLYEYMNTDKGIWESFGYSFSLIFDRFWVNVGSISILYFIIIVLYIIVLSSLGLFGMILGVNFSDINEITMFATRLTELLISPLSLILMNLLSIIAAFLKVGSGMVYFSQKESLENISANKEIDQLGLGEDI